jgi:hypothetical protein
MVLGPPAAHSSGARNRDDPKRSPPIPSSPRCVRRARSSLCAVSLVGYVNRVKKQFGSAEGGESTNRHFFRESFVDIHVALVKSFGDGEKTALVVEPTPRFYKNRPNWIWTKLKELEFSPDPVRISGFTLFDPSHRGHMGTYRASRWERASIGLCCVRWRTTC